MTKKPLLFASLLLDRPGSRTARQLGKIQASALLRSLFNGDLVIWRNFPEPLYTVERKGLYELDFVPTGPIRKDRDLEQVMIKSRLQQAASLVNHSSRYSWIILAHEDVIPLRNWDHLFEEANHDILGSRKRDGNFDEGFFAVRSEVYGLFLDHWSKLGASEKYGDFLGAVIEAAGLTTREFERGEIIRPFEEGVGCLETIEAAAVHLEYGKPLEKTKLAFALYMMRTFGDEDGLFLDLLES